MTMRPRFRDFTICLLVFAAAVLGRPMYLLADQACPAQPDFTRAFLDRHGGDPNAPGLFDGLPVLGPVAGDPNVWEVPCGVQTFAYRWCDPEGMPVRGEVVAADLPAEFVCRPDGTATLTVAGVTPEWHVVHVRLTDEPHPCAALAASRDVLIVFRGQWLPNRPPVLHGGGT